jgi:hypothetical protein
MSPEVALNQILAADIVETEVTSAARHDGYFTATFRVVYVFKGDPSLLGKTFREQFSVRGDSLGGAPVFTWPTEVGEKAIWPVAVLKDGPALMSAVSVKPVKRLIGTFPARSSRTDYENLAYADAQRWAQLVEKVVQARPDDRYEMLKAYTRSPVPVVFTWAVAAMADPDPRAALQEYVAILERDDLQPWQWRFVARAMFDLGLSWSHQRPQGSRQRPSGQADKTPSR